MFTISNLRSDPIASSSMGPPSQPRQYSNTERLSRWGLGQYGHLEPFSHLPQQNLILEENDGMDLEQNCSMLLVECILTFTHKGSKNNDAEIKPSPEFAVSSQGTMTAPLENMLGPQPVCPQMVSAGTQTENLTFNGAVSAELPLSSPDKRKVVITVEIPRPNHNFDRSEYQDFVSKYQGVLRKG